MFLPVQQSKALGLFFQVMNYSVKIKAHIIPIVNNKETVSRALYIQKRGGPNNIESLSAGWLSYIKNSKKSKFLLK